MTSYLLGATVAHVARYEDHGRWRSLCNWLSAPDFDANAFWNEHDALTGDEAARLMPLRHTDRDGWPALPWCSRCAARVRSLADDVLGVAAMTPPVPAASPTSGTGG